MNTAKIIGILLIVGGALGLAFGGFSYTKESTKAELGPISLSVQDEESDNVPVWASFAAFVAGAGLLLAGGR